MADQIKELIEKINQEGVQQAQQRANQIEQEAQAKAEAIIQKANSQAKELIEDAQEKVKRMQESSLSSLKQAGRDLLIVLKKEVVDLLEKIIAGEVSSGLTPDELSKIIAGLIKEYCGQEKQDVVVYLSEADKNKLEGHFLNKLKDELKKGIELRSQADIQAGFIISFDAGKSHFDFTANALAEYIGSSLKPKVAEILKDIK
jgi:V/A-type H+-transporting ATPase subunit E